MSVLLIAKKFDALSLPLGINVRLQRGLELDGRSRCGRAISARTAR